jgi:dTDP-glucose 4,6-dehydratase
MSNILITGGNGFIGKNLVIELLNDTKHLKGPLKIYVCDKNMDGFTNVIIPIVSKNKEVYSVERCISDIDVENLNEWGIDKVIHLAAESNVDFSLNDSVEYIRNNVLCGAKFLETCRQYADSLHYLKGDSFLFVNVSTDEVYGPSFAAKPACVNSKIDPSSPYSASKAAFDSIVNAYLVSYDFPAITTRCSNNFGLYQKDKLIPTIIKNIKAGKPIPLYRDGNQIRNWVSVTHHCKELIKIIAGEYFHGEIINHIQSDFSCSNLELLDLIYKTLFNRLPVHGIDYILVDDRPGHDYSYCTEPTVDAKIQPKMEVILDLITTVKALYENKLD